MPGFESDAPLAVSQLDHTTWETTAPLVFHPSVGPVIDVPIGATTDFASVPALFSWLIPKLTGVPAAVIHDHAWRTLCPGGQLTYRAADRALREALATLGVPAPTRWLTWSAVRWASILTRRGGQSGAWRDLPALVAVTIPGLILAAPAVLLLPSMAVLAALNYLASQLRREDN